MSIVEDLINEIDQTEPEPYTGSDFSAEPTTVQGIMDQMDFFSEEEEDEEFYQSIPPAPLEVSEPSQQGNLETFYGYTPDLEYTPAEPQFTSIDAVPPSDPGMRFLGPVSKNKARDSYLRQASSEKLDEASREQLIEKYVLSVLQEASLQPGFRPLDEELDAERKKRYRKFAEQTSATPEEAEEKYDDLVGMFDEFSYGDLDIDQNRLEYANEVFFREIGISGLSVKDKEKAKKYLNEYIELKNPLSTSDRILQTFMYDPSKIKADDLAGAEIGFAGDVARATTLPLNATSGFLGMVFSAASAPFLNDRYYMEGEAPLDPQTNFVLLNNAASTVFDWDITGKDNPQDVMLLANSFLETGVPEINDTYFKKASEISNRGERIDVGAGPGIPKYSQADVFSVISAINKDKDKIKKEIGKQIFADPSSKYFLGNLPKGQDRISYMQDMRETKAFRDEVESKFKTYASANFAEQDVIDGFTKNQRNYVKIFDKYFPEETAGTEAADRIRKAVNFIEDGFDLSDTILFDIEGMKDQKAALDELLESVPEEYREDTVKALAGAEVGASAFGLSKEISISPVVLNMQQRQNLINRLSMQLAQKKEIQRLREMAQKGDLGPRWSGENLKGSPTEVKEKKKILHAVAPHMILMESLMTNPTYASTAEAFYTTTVSSLAETPFQLLAPLAFIDSLSGTDVFTEEQQKVARELWKQDPAMMIANVGAVLAIGGKVARNKLRGRLNFKDQDFIDNPVGTLRENLEETFPQETKAQSPSETLTIVSDKTSMVPVAETPGGPAVAPYKKQINNIDAELQQIESMPEVERNQARIDSLELEKEANQKLLITKEKFRKRELEAGATEDSSVMIDVADITEDTVRKVNESIIGNDQYPRKVLDMSEQERLDYGAKEVESFLDVVDEAYKSDYDRALADAEYGRDRALAIAGEYFIPNFKGTNLYQMVKALVIEGVDDYRVWKYVLDSDGNPYVKKDNASVAKAISVVRNSNVKKLKSQRRKIISEIETSPGQVPVIYTDNLMSSNGKRRVAARTDRKNKQILIDREQVEKTFAEKAWTKAKVAGVENLAKDAFKTVDEWERFIIEHERVHFTEENLRLPRGAARENDANAKAYNIVSTKSGPASVISTQTKTNPLKVQDRFDSLAIADELSAKGVDRPDAYFGLNLSVDEINGFVETASRNKKATTIVKRKQSYLYEESIGKERDFVEEGPVQGIAIPREEDSFRRTSTVVYGTERMTKRRRLKRAVARTLFGDDIFAIDRAYARTGQKRYIAYAMADLLARPFAIANLPEYSKNVRQEMLMHLYSDPNPNPSKFKNNLIAALEFFSKDSEVIGTNEFYTLRLSEGSAGYRVKQMLDNLAPEKEFTVTPEMLAEYFNEVDRLEQSGALRTFDTMDLHQLASVIIRMSDAEITDKSTGKTYKFGDYAEIKVDAKKFLREKLEFYREKIKEFDQIDGITGQKIKRFIDIIESRFDPENVNTFLRPDELGLNIVAKKQRLREIQGELKGLDIKSDEAAALISERNILRMDLEFASRYDNAKILSSVSDPKYYPKLKVSELDDFQKATLIFANEFVKPRRDAIFDIVTQIMVGEDAVRLMFTEFEGFQNNVVRVLPDGSLKVVQRFSPDQAGELRAKAYRSDATGPMVADKTPGLLRTVSDDELAQSAYLKQRRGPRGTDAPTPTKAKRLFDPDPMNVLESTLSYISDYFDTVKVAKFLESQLDNIKTGNTESVQYAINRTALGILTAVDGGQRLLEKNGGKIRQTLDQVLAMSPEEQQKFLGKSLSTEERFFFEKSFEKAFTADELLLMYSDFQASFQKTVVGLQNTLNTLMLQNELQKKGFILNNSEYNALPKNIQAQYINAEKVKTRLGERVLPTSLDGAYINKRVSRYFQRQSNLQEGIRQGTGISALLNKIQQITKTGLVIDVINNSIARNLYSMVFVQGMLKADVPVNPKYYVRVAKLAKKLAKGEKVDDPRFIRILKSFSGDTSIKRDIKYSRGVQIMAEFVQDLYQYAEDTKAVSRVEKGEAISNDKMVEMIRKNLSFEEVGFQQKVDQFLQKLKTEDIDRDIKAELNPTTAQRAAQAIGVTSDFLISLQTTPDLIAKVAYALQLEDAGQKPRLAYLESLRTFVDYVDVPSYLNFLRYGGSGYGTGGFFGMLTSDFITFTASQSKAYWDAIANNPIRISMFANVSRSNDRALEETLKLKRTMMEIRALKGDPTYSFLPGYTIQEATGREYGERGPFIGGPAGYSGSMISGQTLPFDLFGLMPADPSAFFSRMPRDFSDWTIEDFMSAQFEIAQMQAGGTGNQIYEAAVKKPSQQRKDAIARNQLIESGIIEGDLTEVPNTTGVGGMTTVLASRLVPRILRSMYSLFDGSKRKDQIYGQILGLSVEPFDYGQISMSRTYPAKLYARLNDDLKAMNESLEKGEAIDVEVQQKYFEKLEDIEFKAKQTKNALESEQQYMFLFNEIKLLAKLMAGEITYDQLLKFRIEGPFQ